MEFLPNMFLPHEVEKICCILISRIGASDELLWHYEENGVYSVKSGYQLINNTEALEHEARINQTETDKLEEKKFLCRIWNAEVPNKIRFFAWRMCNGIVHVYTLYQPTQKKNHG